MLYNLYEWSRLAMAPLEMAAAGASGALRNPFNPYGYAPWARAAVANTELFSRLTRRYARPEFGIEQTLVDGLAVEVEEVVVEVKPFCRLLHFQKRTAKPGPRLLIVAPLAGHYATLLRGTVEEFLPDHDVYITDWTNAREIPTESGSFDLSEFTRYIQQYIRLLGVSVHVIAVCQPTIPVLCAISLLAQGGEFLPRSVTLIAGPIDPRINPTAVDLVATEHDSDWFSEQVIQSVPSNCPGSGRRVYPGFLQLTGFVSMNPGLHRDAYLAFYRDLIDGNWEGAASHRSFYDDYNAVLDMPAEFYLETINKVFQTFDLPRGAMDLCGEHVNPATIRATALLTIEGEEDDITGQGQTHIAHALCSGLAAGRKERYTAPGVGHFGVFSGSKFRLNVAPVIRRFIRAHQPRG